MVDVVDLVHSHAREAFVQLGHLGQEVQSREAGLHFRK